MHKDGRYDLWEVLVIDLEATCWRRDPPPGECNEIIEIGSAWLSTASGEIRRGPELLVKPVRSTVSDFCRELTGISTNMLKRNGVTFPEAVATLVRELDGRTVPWASYGDYDRSMLAAECEYYHLPFPLSDAHLNLKRLAPMWTGHRHETGMLRCLRRLGMELEPGSRHHRGCDDALNTARILRKLIGRHPD